MPLVLRVLFDGMVFTLDHSARPRKTTMTGCPPFPYEKSSMLKPCGPNRAVQSLKVTVHICFPCRCVSLRFLAKEEIVFERFIELDALVNTCPSCSVRSHVFTFPPVFPAYRVGVQGQGSMLSALPGMRPCCLSQWARAGEV